MISAMEFHEGMIFEDEGKILQVISYQHHRKSQAKAKVSVKVRDADSGAVLEKSYPSDTKFCDVEVRKKDFQFLYAEGDMLHFMDVETYEQEILQKSKLGDMCKFLVDNMEIVGVYFDGKFRTIEMPANIIATVAFAEPGVKGDSVSNMTKIAKTDNGIELKVPLFIKEGDKVRVDTRTGEYIGRV